MTRRVTKEQVQWQSASMMCYSYWSLGVMLDHWMKCNQKTSSCGVVLYLLPDWGELLIRSVGNVQDLCGFLMLGAYNDAQLPEANRKRLGKREFILWIAHLGTYLMIYPVSMMTTWQDG
jgi:hypothetical protein